MSCNGCRVLHQRCSDACVLRPSIEWIHGDQPQEKATVFVANFFGRAGLRAFLAAVPPHHLPALFRSLLFEACGRTINPVSGAMGLMWTRNWDLCKAAADAVLRGDSLDSLSAVPAAFTESDMAGLYGNVGAHQHRQILLRPLLAGELHLRTRQEAEQEQPRRRRRAAGEPAGAGAGAAVVRAGPLPDALVVAAGRREARRRVGPVLHHDVLRRSQRLRGGGRGAGH